MRMSVIFLLSFQILSPASLLSPVCGLLCYLLQFSDLRRGPLVAFADRVFHSHPWQRHLLPADQISDFSALGVVQRKPGAGVDRLWSHLWQVCPASYRPAQLVSTQDVSQRKRHVDDNAALHVLLELPVFNLIQHGCADIAGLGHGP